MSSDLPQDCWEWILDSLDHYCHFESLSLVSTQFLSITNHLRRSLTVTSQTLPSLPRLLCRFPNLKHIDLPELCGGLDYLLRQVSGSGLDLESICFSNQSHFPLLGLGELGRSMRNLRKLNCSKICYLQDRHLLMIGYSLPLLEDLDISFPQYNSQFNPDGSLDSECFSMRVTDDGILGLAMNLKKLLNINLSGNHFITDKSLLYLSVNCVLLREIAIRQCDFITENGIALAMRNCENLNSISLDGIGVPSVRSVFQESFRYMKNLCELDLSHSFISDELLCLVADACLPLKRLTLCRCYDLTSVGVSCLLNTYRFLEYLNLEGANFLTDDCIIELSKFLSRLSFVNLSFCSKLTSLSFFTIVRSCPLLRDLQMERTNLGVEEFSVDLVKNCQIKSLNLGENESLSDEFMDKVALCCPNLQMLSISHCPNITEQGIQKVLGNCSEVKHLEMNHCWDIQNLDFQIELPKLEVLLVKGQCIHDEALGMIARKCQSLLRLDLEGCSNVTKEGLNEVLRNCGRLREMNLKWFDNLKLEDISRLVFSRPSLRKIVAPDVYAMWISDKHRKFFLCHGCLVTQD